MLDDAPLPTTVRDPRPLLDAFKARWGGRSDLWVFGYASLIWRPEFESAEERRGPDGGDERDNGDDHGKLQERQPSSHGTFRKWSAICRRRRRTVIGLPPRMTFGFP